MSLAVNYTHAAQFRAAGYVPLTVDGVEYGEVRQYGNFSFTRIYEAGHQVPYYQPIRECDETLWQNGTLWKTANIYCEASLALFNRSIFGYNVADGSMMVTADYSTTGDAHATHTEPFVPLPSTTKSSAAASATVVNTTGARSPKVAVPRLW